MEQIVLGLKALQTADDAMRKPGDPPTPAEKAVATAIDQLVEKLAFHPATTVRWDSIGPRGSMRKWRGFSRA